ncbi:hypothetical protein LBMAG21_13680 [Armatimonadota bacterium]|nr:hypothetical protein LBMAG21_13680 [Armatimonadota bacterium]
MKVGRVLECQKDGPDAKVLKELFRKCAPDIEASVATMSNKPNLLKECGIAARNLLAEGCAHVVIVWDLFPTDWGDALQQSDRTPCLHQDRARVLQSLRSAGVDESRVALVAITYMLETWLLADKQAIARFLSAQLGRKIITQRAGKADPTTEKSPKDALSEAFERNDHPHYRDSVHALKIAQQLVSLRNLQKRPDFDRFWQKATQRT